MDTFQQKHQLRKEMRERRHAFGQAQTDAALKIKRALLDFSLIGPEKKLATYWPLPTELDPRLFIDEFQAQGGTTLLPAIDPQGNNLSFYKWQNGSSLSQNALGVMEPKERADPIDPDILLVPLLAFDIHGYRLGYGKGFYDRALQELRSTGQIVAIGLAFDAQKVPFVPYDVYDQKLDYVITPTTVYEF